MILYFLRHASAGDSLAIRKKMRSGLWTKRASSSAGMWAAPWPRLNVQVDAIVSSPLKRATQTASLVGNELGYEGKLQLECCPASRCWTCGIS